MAENSKIQWTTHSFNPWLGCTKVSPGCKNCYAETTTRARVLRSRGQETWGKGKKRERTSEAYWKEPLKWNKRPFVCSNCQHLTCDERALSEKCICAMCGSIGTFSLAKVFCASTADWLDEEVPIEWLHDLLRLIYQTPNLIWQLLTKRPENWRERVEKCVIVEEGGDPSDRAGYFADWDGEPPKSDFAAWLYNWLGNEPPENVWIGASAENQEYFDRRYMPLSEIPARVRFWSMEPLLDAIDFTAVHYISSFKRAFHWVIVGGESGSRARECQSFHISDIVSQCELADVPCFVKQLGSNPRTTFPTAHMKDKKGGDIMEWPKALRVRQFPAVLAAAS
ncbi:DUF5131 family protein [Prosthecobacter sp.]|uniref:DUF5131 family protein n=1 Tax=Prosthecobacter sp. TaxID=1965333 RepID=UPI003783297A